MVQSVVKFISQSRLRFYALLEPPEVREAIGRLHPLDYMKGDSGSLTEYQVS